MIKYFNLIILLAGCFQGDVSKDSSEDFEFEGDVVSVKIPIPANVNLIQYNDTFMDDSEYYRFTDTLKNYTIIIHPNRFGAVNNDKYYLRQEDEILSSYRSLCSDLNSDKSFEVPINTYITEDSMSRSSLRYYTSWRVDSIHVIKMVEFIRSVENSKGWCSVRIKKEYHDLNIPKDYQWARSFDEMEMKITKEFLNAK